MSSCGGGKSFQHRDDVSEKSMWHNQSVWMAHWTRTTNTSGNKMQVRYESKEESHNNRRHCSLLGEPEIGIDSPKLVKGFGEVTTSMGKSRNEMLQSRSFPMFKSPWNRESILASKNVDSYGHHGEIMKSQIDPTSEFGGLMGRNGNSMTPTIAGTPSENETQLREYQTQHEGIRWNEEEQSNKLLGKRTLVASTPFQVDIVGSSSKIIPYEHKSGMTSMQSNFSGEDDINHQHSAHFLREKNVNTNAGLLMQDPSTSNNFLCNLASKKFEKMPHHSGVELSTTEISPPYVSKLEKLCHGSYALSKMPCSVHNMETMRMCTTEFSRGSPNFSHTTRHFFITEKTDVNLLDSGQMLGLSAKYKGKTVSGLLSLSPNFGFPVKQGVKLQPLDSSTESEEKESLGVTKASVSNLKNESSAETDTMDMDVFRENHLSGVASSPSNKDVKGAKKSSTSPAAPKFVREEIGNRLLSTELPDINQELPAVAGAGSLACDRDTSTSRTESLDVEQFLSHAEHPTNSKLNASVDGIVELDPCSRWVKRLKPSASDSVAHGTKCTKMEEASSHEKVSKLFNKILKCSKTTSEPVMCKSCGKEPIEVDQTAELQRNAVSSSPVSVRNAQDIMPSHAWIRRWCQNPAASAEKKPVNVMVCEPQSSKARLADLEKKQFPSIAAMALMAKAMTVFRPCEFTKRGALLVWNTKR